LGIIWDVIPQLAKVRHAEKAGPDLNAQTGTAAIQQFYSNPAKTDQPMPDHLVFISPQGTPPEDSRPAPERVISGDPVFTSWNHEEKDGLLCGI
jgi:hypothetical protein